ncbi:hypothetical protein [Entomomonas asaccharolytica]|uniref:Uncharacterized protein n=2 Tax=Entomomonas asaccharolytica TaxID=2785331 RepID=A0A974NEA6_9GAMM|nr:hypothetical protein [Entomomonas asaccharolytica]QQP85004.1 hypothetical protein JHT90_11480 [Entomomonas asaccharolytica]
MADEKKKPLVLGTANNVIAQAKDTEVDSVCIAYERENPERSTRVAGSIPYFLDRQIKWNIATEVPPDGTGEHLEGYLIYDPNPYWN